MFFSHYIFIQQVFLSNLLLSCIFFLIHVIINKNHDVYRLRKLLFDIQITKESFLSINGTKFEFFNILQYIKCMRYDRILNI